MSVDLAATRPDVKPPPRPAETVPAFLTRGRLPRAVWRFRLAATCLVLTAIMFLQDPGRIAADTKLDLSINPGGLLGRALHLWDPGLFSGSLQNQAYGYLWPMGPFFWVGHAAGIPAWVVQRLWWSLLVCAAFLGVVKLVRLLGLGGPLSRVVAGFAYALSPLVVTKLGLISSEVLPIALAPWMLIPLVIGAQRGSARRYAALSALAVLCMGGVNAVATVAVLPLGVIWLLTRAGGRRKWNLLGWWSAGIALATLWWAIPLVVLGRYSPPFLDWIESAAITTRFTDPSTVMRGTEDWLAYIVDGSGPVAGAGWQLVTRPLLIVATGAVAALGVAGISKADIPHRLFIIVSVFAGIVLLTLGHVGPIDGLGAPGLQSVLDGALSPLRNIHKFDPVLRLPLALGLAWLLTSIRAPRNESGAPSGGRRRLRLVVTGIAIGAVFISATPLLTGSLVRDRSFVSIPGYWQQTATWLDENATDSRSLVVPGASFGSYLWGRTQDEPLQPLTDAPWSVRDAVPLATAGGIRFLDAVEQRLDTGVGSPGLAVALRRAGIRWLVVRNDLDSTATGSPRPILVHQALSRSPGIKIKTFFGPWLSPYTVSGTSIDADLGGTYPAVEIFEVAPKGDAESTRAVLRDARATVGFTGSAEALIPLLDAGVVTNGPTVAAADEQSAGLAQTNVQTDTYRDRELNFGAVRNNVSQTRTADAPFDLDRPIHDFFPFTPEGWQPSARFEGVSGFSASSSGSAVTAARGRAPASQPFSAMDGDPLTSWISGDYSPAVGQWWQVNFEKPISIPDVRVRFLNGGLAASTPSEVGVSTNSGSVVAKVRDSSDWQVLPVPAGKADHLRIAVLGVQGGGAGKGAGISEVVVPGVLVGRSVVAGAKATGSDALVFSAREGRSAGCAELLTQLVCSPKLTQAGEEDSGIDRVVHLERPMSGRLVATVTPRPGDAISSLLKPLGRGITATASSTLVPDPASRAQSATDKDVGTTWIARQGDPNPTLQLRLPEARSVKGLKLYLADRVAASSPLQVDVRVGGRTFPTYVDLNGEISFPETSTRDVGLKFNLTSPRYALDQNTGTGSGPLPVGVTEVAIDGADDLRNPLDRRLRVLAPCGFGPTLYIDGKAATTTKVEASVADVIAGRAARATSCGPPGDSIRLSAGDHRLQMASTPQFLATSVAVAGKSPKPSVTTNPVIAQWDSNHRELNVTAASHDQVLELSENSNPGWEATLGGRTLTPVTVDGWRQAWVVPAGAAGTATLIYAPDATYRFGLLVGLAAVLVLLGLLIFPVRSGSGEALSSAKGTRTLVALCALTLALVGGFVGLGVGVVAALFGWKLNRFTGWFSGALVLASALVYAWNPWPDSRHTSEWLAGVSVVLVLIAIALVVVPELASLRPRRRSGDQD